MLVKGGLIVNYDGKFLGDILIENGIITKVTDEIDEEVDELIDARGKYVFPGFIDAHTHPGLPEDLGYFKNSNDFYTETKAAKVGGTTTIFDFAEQGKGEKLNEALYKRRKRYEGKAQCKFSFHVAITEVGEDIFHQLQEIKEAGVNSIKLYTTYNMKLGNDEILKVMDCCAKLDMVVLVHCEDDSIIKYCSANNEYEGTRPAEAEYNMVHTIISFAKVTGCKVYICHVSSKESASIIKKAKEEGVTVYFETCPQYLIFNKSIYRLGEEERTKYILSPPFREKADCQALIDACKKRTVDLISTDHCAFLFKEHKAKFFSDINKAAKGMPGIQLRGSLAYDILVNKNGMSLEDFIALVSYNPAKILGLMDRGCIREGMAADIVIWSDEEFVVSIKDIEEGTDYSPYENMKLCGKPVRVISI